MTPEELASIEALLESERERVAAGAASLAAEHEAVVAASTQSNADDEHDPEGATIGFERAQIASLLALARARLSELDQAAGRLRAGSYGICQRCGQAIAFERLTAHPAATTCVSCAGAQDRSSLRRR